MHATSNLAHIHFPFDPPLFSPASACQMQGIWQRTIVPGEGEGATRCKEPGILNNHKESLTDQRQSFCILHKLEINLHLWGFVIATAVMNYILPLHIYLENYVFIKIQFKYFLSNDSEPSLCSPNLLR